ncbi:glucose-1-phosphate adenylyltransferase subunit GlgD [Chloroflexota bacterium]
MEKVFAIILAGGQGQRLSILAQERAKPALPFAGKYRIIDFALSNCVNSGISNIAVLAQYEPRSLIEHIGTGSPWSLDRPGRQIRLLQPYLARKGHDWYKGTADAVFQNLPYIEEQDTGLVLILSGDHAYKMNYANMVKFHEETQSDVTLAVTTSAEDELERFGTVALDETGQVTCFQEKSKNPKGNMVSMGIYLFKKDFLKRWLEEDAQTLTSKHDFGKNVFPRLVGNSHLSAYFFDDYWKDIGTVQAYWESNTELLEAFSPPLFTANWPIFTMVEHRPPAFISEPANVVSALVSDGCVIEGRVEHSILSPGVIIAEGAVVKDSIIMSDSVIGQGSVVDHAILDKEVVVEAGCQVGFGFDFQPNRVEPHLLDSGITIVGKKAVIPTGIKVGRNCVIWCGVGDKDFSVSEIQSGETIYPDRKQQARRKK